jgi:hypothetical protein
MKERMMKFLRKKTNLTLRCDIPRNPDTFEPHQAAKRFQGWVAGATCTPTEDNHPIS